MPSERYLETQRITIFGGIVNVILSIAQIVGGLLLNSQALVADGVHTLADLVSDVIVLVSANQARKRADHKHPYGYARFETGATVILGVLLALVGVGILYSGVMNAFSDTPLPVPSAWVLSIAVVVILAKEALYQMTVRIARRIQSKLLEANAWHHRSDAISSVIVLLGVAGTLLGFTWMDSLAAIIVGMMIIKMAFTMSYEGFMELLDAGVESKQASEMAAFIQQQAGVIDLHQWRTRRMGSAIIADAHIQVAEDISVSEGHHIANRVRQNLQQKYPELMDITVHIDPEDDTHEAVSAPLPSRAEVLALLQQHCSHHAVWSSVERIGLHYVAGAIQLDIYLKSSCSSTAMTAFECDTQNLAFISKTQFFLDVTPVLHPSQ